MTLLSQLLQEQNTNFKLREKRVDILNDELSDKIIKAQTKDDAIRLLTQFRINYDAIKLMS